MSFKFLCGLVLVSVFQYVAHATATTMSSELGNGLWALEIKIEAEQVQVADVDLLQRIINLADQIMKESDDAMDELSKDSYMSEKVNIDATQLDAYLDNHSNDIKSIGYKLWKDCKNVTMRMQDTAEVILDTEASKQMDLQYPVPENATRRARRTANESVSTPTPSDVNATTVSANVTEVVATTTMDPVYMVDVEAQAKHIMNMADHATEEFDRDLDEVVKLAHEMMIVLEFQTFNLVNSEDATEETRQDSKDTESKIMEYCEKIIDTANNIKRQNARSMNLITMYASSVQNDV